MSYTDISDKFEVLVSHLKKGSAQVYTLCNFFKQYKKTFDVFSNSLTKLDDTFSIDTPNEGSLDTLSTALISVNSHLRKLSQNNISISKQIQLDIIEPLELFAEHHEITKGELVSRGTNINRGLRHSRSKLNKYRQKYYKTSMAAEKAELLKQPDQLRDSQTKFLHKSFYAVQANKLQEKYEESIMEVNAKLEQFDSIMPGILEALQQNEESRIHFMKYSLEKYVKHFQTYQINNAENCGDINNILDNVNSTIDVIIFVDINKSKDPYLKPEIFTSYEEFKLRKSNLNFEFKEEDYEIMDPVEEENEIEQIKVVINYLIPFQIGLDTSVTTEDSFVAVKNVEDKNYNIKVFQVLSNPDGRRLFVDILESRSSLNCMEETKLKELSVFFKEAFNFMLMDDDNDAQFFCKILEMSHTFYSENKDGKRKYLANYCKHPLFDDKARWVQAIHFSVLCKIESERENSNRIKPKSAGLFGNIVKQIKENMPVFIKDSETERAERSAAFTVLSEFCVYLNQIGASIDLSNSIVLKICQKYDLDEERICLLLAEIQTNQKFKSNVDTSSIKKRSKEKRRWGDVMPIALALEFLDHEDYNSILNVSKLWRKSFQGLVYKRWLLDWELDYQQKDKIRGKIWKESLRANTSLVDYNALLTKVIAEPEIIGDLNEIIEMDVSRSYQYSSQISSESLKNLLRTYAFYNLDVGYCQGMNYIAGTLYIQLQDEESSFRCMIGMIDKFQMHTLFINNLPKLKQLFYQLDRLIGLFMPDVHELFKDIEISSAHFSSSWFLTVFASILQYQPDILIPIWDMFILQGWKAVFKVCIVIIERVSKVFIGVRFEDVMMVFSTIHTVNSPVSVFDETFIISVKSLKLSSRLLRDLESEYKHLKLKASQSQR